MDSSTLVSLADCSLKGVTIISTPRKKQRHLKLRREAWAKRDGRHVNLKRKYGLSEGGFNTLLDSQGGGCAICGATPDRFHVDHCHHSNKVRGILCSGCNTGLGKLGDSVEGLKKALAYLERAEHE